MNDAPTPEEFKRRYSELLLARAAPIFEQAALSAREAGLYARVHTDGDPPELCLQVSSDETGHASHYLIQLDQGGQQVRHQLLLAIDGSSRRISGGLDSINNMVLDTHLSTLFREGFSVTLPALEERHPRGFW